MFFDKVAQKRYELENYGVLFNTLQGVVLGSSGAVTELRTPLGVTRVVRNAGDRPGVRRIRVKTGFGDAEIPF